MAAVAEETAADSPAEASASAAAAAETKRKRATKKLAAEEASTPVFFEVGSEHRTVETIYKPLCECGTCYRVTSTAKCAEDVKEFFEHRINYDGVQLVKTVEAVGGVAYSLEMHIGNVRKICVSGEEQQISATFENFVDKLNFLWDESMLRAFFAQYVALCVRLRAVRRSMAVSFYCDAYRRIYAFPVQSMDAEGAHYLNREDAPILLQCAYSIVSILYGGDVAKIVQHSVVSSGSFLAQLIPSEMRKIEGVAKRPTDVLLIDFLRCLVDQNSPKDGIHLHPYFCSQRCQVINAPPTWQPGMTEARRAAFANHPSHANLLSMGQEKPRKVEAAIADAAQTFHALVRDVRMTTAGRVENDIDQMTKWFDVITPGVFISPYQCAYFTDIVSARDNVAPRGEGLMCLHLMSDEKAQKEAEEDPYHVRCHACIGMRMCSMSSAVIGTILHNELNEKHEVQLERVRQSAEIEFKQRVELACGSIRVFSDQAVTDIKDHGGDVAAMMARMTSLIQVSSSLPQDKARVSLWAVAEAVLVTNLVSCLTRTKFKGMQNHARLQVLQSTQQSYTRKFFKFLTTIHDAILKHQEVPMYVKNVLKAFGINGASPHGDLVFDARLICREKDLLNLVRCGGGHEDPAQDAYVESSRSVPLCVMYGDRHGSQRSRLPFAFMSIIRSRLIQETADFNSLNIGNMRFFSSLEDGRGVGVNSAIVNDFFDAVFEDHTIFRRVETSDGGPPMYTLNCSQRAQPVCPGCSQYLQSLKSSRIPREQSQCMLMASSHFATCLAFMLRYVLLTERVLQFRIHPSLLRILLEPDKSKRAQLGFDVYHAFDISSVRVIRPESTNSLLDTDDKVLSSLGVEFPADLWCAHNGGDAHFANSADTGNCRCNSALTRATKLSYLHSQQNHMAVTSRALLLWWKQCAEEFHFPLLSMILGTSCGTSGQLLSDVLSGSAPAMNGIEILKNVNIQSVYCQEGGFFAALSSFSYTEYALQRCIVSCETFEGFSGIFSQAMTPFADSARVAVSECLEKLRSIDVNSARAFSQIVSTYSELLRNKYFLPLIALFSGEVSAVYEDVCSILVVGASFSTSAYFIRWASQCSQADAERFVYMATGKRHIHTSIAQSETNCTRVRRTVIMLIEMAKRFEDNGISNDGINLMKSALIPDSASKRSSASEISVYSLKGASSLFSSVNLKNHPTFKDAMAEILKALHDMIEESTVSYFCGKNVSILVNWSSLRGRLPTYSTCTRSLGLGAYDSYEHFKGCLGRSMSEEGAAFSLV